MFKINDGHLQDDLFNQYNSMRPAVAKLLDKTWAPIFYEQVFCKINENLFAPMYSLDTGRPNTPVNILMSLEIFKHMFGFSDQELLEQFYFNYQINYAMGIRNLGEIYLAERTLYEFRLRVYNYILEHPEEDDVIFKQFINLTQNFIEQAGIKTDEQRMDSTLITPNIKKAGRLSLAHDVLAQAVNSIPINLLSIDLKEVLKDGFKTDLLYKTRNQELDNRLQKVLDLMQEIEKLAGNNPGIASAPEILLLKRFLSEQADYNKEQDKWIAKANKDISSGSMQSAYDSDATFRDKAGKKHSGYNLNMSETCSKENQVQIITDYTLEPNNTSDVNIAKERLPEIKENTGVNNLYVDGGYYGEEVLEKANELEINLHYTDMTGRKVSRYKIPTTSFEIDEKMKVIKCPRGKKPIRSDYNPKTKSSSSNFSHEDCEGCPDFDACPVKCNKKTRVLRISSKTILADQTREQISNKEIRRKNTSSRAAIEGTNSALKRGEDANKLDVRGIIKSSIVCGYKVIARNIKQFARLILGKIRKPKPKPILG